MLAQVLAFLIIIPFLVLTAIGHLLLAAAWCGVRDGERGHRNAPEVGQHAAEPEFG